MRHLITSCLLFLFHVRLLPYPAILHCLLLTLRVLFNIRYHIMDYHALWRLAWIYLVMSCHDIAYPVFVSDAGIFQCVSLLYRDVSSLIIYCPLMSCSDTSCLECTVISCHGSCYLVLGSVISFLMLFCFCSYCQLSSFYVISYYPVFLVLSRHYLSFPILPIVFHPK